MPKEQSRIDNPEKLAILSTQYEDQQSKQHRQYVLDTTFTQANTNNMNKIWALLQTTRRKDDPNIGFMRNYDRHHNTKLST